MSKRLVNQDRQVEQAAQSELLDILEGKFTRPLTHVILSASLEMIEDYRTSGNAPRLPETHLRDMTDIVKESAALSIVAFGDRILDQGKSAGLILETKDFEELFLRFIEAYIQQEAVRARITNIAETTRNRIIAQIVAGQEEGLSVAEIAKELAKNAEIDSQLRGALIARTETHGAANYGAHQAARATGLRLKQEWVAAADERTRTAHRAADGQVVGMDQGFNVDGELLRFPGDPVGSPWNIINCRCAVSHIVDD